MILPLSVVAVLMIPSPVALASFVTMPESSVQHKGNVRAEINGNQQVINAYRNQQSDVIVDRGVGA